MASSSEEFVKCPHCGVLIPKSSIYCLNCGKRVKPRTYLSKIRGLSIFSEAVEILSKNFGLIFLVFPVMFLSLFVSTVTLMVVYAYSDPIWFDDGFLSWTLQSLIWLIVFLIILVVFEGWLTTATVNVIQMDKIRVKESFKSAIRKFSALLKVALFYYGIFLAPNAIILLYMLIFRRLYVTASSIPIYIFLVAISVLFMFLVPLSMIKNVPFKILLNEAIERLVETFLMDKKFVIIVAGYYLLFYSTLLFIFENSIFMLIHLFLYTIVTLAQILYLKVNFALF